MHNDPPIWQEFQKILRETANFQDEFVFKDKARIQS